MQREGILVAVRPVAMIVAELALSHTLPLTFTHTMDDASLHLRSGRFAVVLGTLQFDDSRLFDLIPVALESRTPVIVVKLMVSKLPPDMIAASFAAALAMGCAACLDLREMTARLGLDQSMKSFREEVLKVASDARD